MKKPLKKAEIIAGRAILALVSLLSVCILLATACLLFDNNLWPREFKAIANVQDNGQYYSPEFDGVYVGDDFRSYQEPWDPYGNELKGTSMVMSHTGPTPMIVYLRYAFPWALAWLLLVAAFATKQFMQSAHAAHRYQRACQSLRT